MKAIITTIATVCLSLLFLVCPVSAKCPDGSVPVSFLDSGENIVIGTEGEHCLKDDQKGSGVIYILNFVLDILTIGIAIIAVIGVVVSGITYLTAGDNENKTRVAKQRIYEIVIGLITYAAVYALLKWLLPGFNN